MIKPTGFDTRFPGGSDRGIREWSLKVETLSSQAKIQFC
jgi:hypothetical protein